MEKGKSKNVNQIQEKKELFISCCPELTKNRKVEMFVKCFCPIAIVDADVQEYVVDEYDSVELFILRLYSAGIRKAEEITELTGIDVNMVNKLILAEKDIYGHIDSWTGDITSAGEETLRDNTDPEHLFQHALYDVKRELQVEAVTGSLIRMDAEIARDRLLMFSDRFQPVLLARNSISIDSKLEEEINTRLKEYINKGILSEKNAIKRIGALKTMEILYRSAFFVKIEGFQYPFLAIEFFEKTDTKEKKVILPTAISQTDSLRAGIAIDRVKYPVRSNAYFSMLQGYQDSLSHVDEEMNTEDEGRLKREENRITDDRIPDGLIEIDKSDID